MSKKALLFSAQDFQTPIIPQLNGCKNDTKIWKNTLTQLGFAIDDSRDIHHNKTRDNAFNLIKKFIDELQDGDTGIVFFSGHAINLDLNIRITIEGLIFNDNKNIYEFQILQELTNLHDNAKLILIIDSCFSRGFAQYKRLSLISNLEAYKSRQLLANDVLELEYKIIDDKLDGINHLLIPINSKIIDDFLPRIPHEIIIPPNLLNIESKREEVLTEIKACIEDSNHKSNVFSLSEKVLVYKKNHKSINNLKATQRGKLMTNTSNTINTPTAVPLRIRGYKNITLIAAEDDISQKAYERQFTLNDGYEIGHYGAFSFYATKTILNNLNITYQEFKTEVNKALREDPHVDIKEQQMDFDSGNTNWNRKLFT
ncbi:MAG: caspase family protein [Kordia sp.]|uniref:caspase family protein n=1 Tax=Kordia sp. TaxID=1965332 RepID=UPI0038596FDC